MPVRLLHNIGHRRNENYTPAEVIEACDDFLTFDGVYRNVYENRHILQGKKGILFVTGDYVGGDNSFDAPMPLEKFCTMDEVLQIANETGFDIGWHTWSHRDLTALSDEELEQELTPMWPIDPIFLAYPYGRYNNRVVEKVREMGYKRAYSVTQGNDDPLTLRREYL